MMFRRFRSPLLVAACMLSCVLSSQSTLRAQSGRNPPHLRPTPAPTPAPQPTPIDTTHYDKVKVLVSRGLDGFVKDLNAQGQLGYRLEKTVSYGDKDEDRRYAAVLHLDPGHRYEYDYDRMPDDVRYGHPLNHYAQRGYSLAHTYAVAECSREKRGASFPDPYDINNWPTIRVSAAVKGNAFLFVRRDGARTQTREYRLFTGTFAQGEAPKEDLQAALDDAPPGFRPVGLFFTKQALGLFRVSVVAERDLNETAPAKVDYRLVKEVEGFDEEVNKLAAAGSRYVGGGRAGSVKVAVLARQAGGATAYTFIDDQKYDKEFDRAVAAGNSYEGLMAGDLSCGSEEVRSQKFVFAREAGGVHAREYKILRLPGRKAGLLSGPALAELERLLGANFRVRDIFHAYGLYLILEK